MKNQKNPWLLAAEALILFVGLPLLFYLDVIPIPKIVALLAAAGYCAFQLWHDPEFGKSLLVFSKDREAGKGILIRLPVVTLAILGLVLWLRPDQLFSFPAERPFIWVAVMLLYPLLSALPQEFIYRTYFFHRYESFMSLKYSVIISSAIAFGYLHIIYDNWWAVGLSFAAGILFGMTYNRTRSLFWVTLEHALYGSLVFTLGLGEFFYEPF